MAMNSFVLCFAIILASTVCLSNGETGSMKILYKDEAIEKYEEKLPNKEEEFKCEIKGLSHSKYEKEMSIGLLETDR